MNKESFDQLLKSQMPIAWIAGVRYESCNQEMAKTSVVLDLLNQNPFGSMFWAIEGMAAEFAGGMMLISKIMFSGKSISSLVVKTESTFSKKALGKIVFSCDQGKMIDARIQTAIETGEPTEIELTSIATDEEGDEVARFVFTWSIRLRS
jgi:hypothetical protein